MNTSLFELFKIGIGPSSSHTVGPMRAAHRFVSELAADGLLDQTQAVEIDLYGSLALTGLGHGTDRAVLLGLLGQAPATVDPAAVPGLIEAIHTSTILPLLGRHSVSFDPGRHLRYRRDQMYPESSRGIASNTLAGPATPLSQHPNGLRFIARDASGTALADSVFYSIGGGFIVSAAEYEASRNSIPAASLRSVPYPFRSALQLLALAEEHGLSIADLVLANEVALIADESIVRPPMPQVVGSAVNKDIRAQSSSEPESGSLVRGRVEAEILALWKTMRDSIDRGIATEGILPGGLNVRRRACRLAERLRALEVSGKIQDPLAPLDWVTVYAMAVNEENAAGGRVVTAPTNGAAGVIPAIALYYDRFLAQPAELTREETEAGLLRYFLTAAAIGILYKENASISGAEVGCQGEVGVACSMAAGGLVAAQNGTNAQIEHAAEIAMEHNLGMTCDPIGGLVQIPCIERNGMGAVKAINASRMAMHETGGHKLSLDQVIATMYQTGLDMQSRYKETSLAGLALNIIEC